MNTDAVVVLGQRKVRFRLLNSFPRLFFSLNLSHEGISTRGWTRLEQSGKKKEVVAEVKSTSRHTLPPTAE